MLNQNFSKMILPLLILVNVLVHATPPSFCPFTNIDSKCSMDTKYRAHDGSCNNMENTMLGKSITPYKRLLPPAYDDSIGTPRKLSKIDSQPLPNARQISLTVHASLSPETPTAASSRLSHLGVIFGQFINHDLSLAASTSKQGTQPLKCTCTMSDNADCINVDTPKEDTLFADQSCMSLTRSGASIDKFDCTLNAREQVNLVTHWLDLSQVYGNDEQTTKSIRAMKRGLMKTSRIPGLHEQLPKATKGGCVDEKNDETCFESGDTRTSQNLMLTSFHMVFMREHNRLAKEMRRMHRDWTDDNLYEEARRINTAIYQHIVYKEWLPIVLGGDKVKEFQLEVNTASDYFMGYNSSVNPHMAAEFSGAAFRFGHSLVRSNMSKADSSLNPISNLTLSSIFLRPIEAYRNGGLDSICRGMLSDPGNVYDPHVTDALENHLFENNQVSGRETHRFSLPAINIIRGRDHGLPSYAQFRSLRLKVDADNVTQVSFDDLASDMSVESLSNLKMVYKNADDIDAFSGGLSETPLAGGVIGPTFAHIIGSQFRDLKMGDRFFYENGGDLNARFSLDQLNEIRKTSMARILCNTLDLLTRIQKRAFEPSSSSSSDGVSQSNPNEMVKCTNLDTMDLGKWSDEKLSANNAAAAAAASTDTTTDTTTVAS